MANTTSTGTLVFPDHPQNGDTHTHDGMEYQFVTDHWVVIPPNLDDLGFDDRFVFKKGDVMTGSLTCPLFIGNYDLEVLTELPPPTPQ